VATAAQNRLSINKRNLYTAFCGSERCRTIAIYEYTA
jgi:hypothetical protein